MGRTVRILAIGIAPLDHETWNDPMKGRAAIETLAGQLREVLHMPWRYIMIESQHDIAQMGPFAADGNDRPRLLCRL
jgi:hypothetical protein